jgi:ferric-dicitrate binding protein FerR (iron transport regulator)
MPSPRLEYLFSLQTGQIISPAEREELLALINDPANDADLRDLIARAIEVTGGSIPLPDQASRAILLTILQTALPQPAAETPVIPMHYPRRTRRWSRYAAAVILLLAGMGTWWALHRSPTTPVPHTVAAHDLAPGGNKATLTLADGSHITLDSANTGVVAKQGNATVQKLANGRLAYRRVEAPSTAVLFNTLTTPRGGQYQLSLPDGTQVWLNAQSSITYPTAFTGSTRKVTITGEAYFEVVKNAHQPFSVEDKGMTIEVLGTSFNVNGYDDEEFSTTTLVEGKVQVSYEKVGALQNPGMQARVFRAPNPGNQLPAIKVGQANIEEALAWKNGLFQFDHADVQTVMRQLARWYDVDVSYEGPVPDDRFQGKIPRDANVSQVFRVLQKEQVHFRIEGKKIIVTK